VWTKHVLKCAQRLKERELAEHEQEIQAGQEGG
jgi:hypothetical protein